MSPSPIEITDWKYSKWNKCIALQNKKQQTGGGTRNESHIDGICFDDIQTGPEQEL